MRSLFSFLIFSLSSLSLNAQFIQRLSDYPNCGYVTPLQLLEANKNLIDAEGGSFTTVPLDYRDLSRGTTQVYSYFAGGYDPKKPTYVMFTGGPGQNSHLQNSAKFSFYETLGFNFLIFDQRGIALSRLTSEELARDARNFSSEATARDVLTILNKLGIQKVSIYGASYGTVPATIFASLFPERTHSLVLEGVVYDGWDGIMAGRNVTGVVQKFYDSLPAGVKDRLDELINEKKIPEYWLPMMTRAFMMQYGITQFPTFRQAIEEALIKRKLESAQDIGNVFSELGKAQPGSELTENEMARAIKWHSLRESKNQCRMIQDSDDLNHLLMLKEFDASLPNVTNLYALRNRKIVAVTGSNYSYSLSKFSNMSFNSYSASQYKVKVPTFYIQGTADGATPAPGASLHYKNSAIGPSQLLFFKGSSHMPFGLTIYGMNRAEENWQDLQKVFAQLLGGQPITCEMKDFIEKRYKNINLAIATKGFPEKIKCN